MELDAYAALRSRNYRLLLTGHLLSHLGLQMLSVAVSWDLYLATKSAIVLGNVGFVQVAPALLLGLHAGHIADRYDRRRIVILAQALVLIGSGLLLAAPPSVVLIYSVLFLAAVARAFQWSARAAILPGLVPSEALHNALTWFSSATELGSISGPALAGVLLASVGSKTVYVLQFACAAVSLACYYSIQLPAAQRPIAPDPARASEALREGLGFVWKDPLILPAISLDLFAVLFGGATALLPIFSAEILHSGARGLGWLRAAPSMGAISMAFLTAHLPAVRRAGLALLWAVAGYGAATVVFGVSRSLALSFVMLLLVGACDNVSVVLRNAVVQTRTPDQLRGRVSSVHGLFISSSNQLGAVESGWTAAWFGAVPSVVAGGLATIAIVTGFAARSSALRKWRQW
jgi:MFS family permease